MTDELADRLDSLADETTRAADALLMREAAATIRAERVAPDHQAVTLTIHQALAPWHMSIATAMGSQEHYNELLATIADALIASGVLGNTEGNNP